MKEYVIKNVYTVGAGKWMEAAWLYGGKAKATKCHHYNTCDVVMRIPDNVPIKKLMDYVKYCR